MTRWIAILLTAAGSLGTAYAQDSAPGPGAVVVTIIPAGVTFFTEGTDTAAPSFNTYDLGASVEVHINHYISVEGEVIGSLGVEQDLQYSSETLRVTPPNLLSYGGSLVLSSANRSSLVPYVTAGVGALTMFDKADLAINETQTFLMGNVGGGVKWFRGRWGLRADYRFIRVESNDDVTASRVRAPGFFGPETRYGHRVFGAVLIRSWR